MKLLFFDTETTSIKPGSICQLSYITVDASTKPQVTTGKNFFFTVDEMDPSAQEIHGFSLEKLYELSEGHYFEDLAFDFINDFRAYYKDICRIPKANGEIKNPKLSEVIDWLNVSEKQIAETSEKLFEGSGNYHDARFDTAATYLTVIEGLKKGHIAKGYFTNILKQQN